MTVAELTNETLVNLAQRSSSLRDMATRVSALTGETIDSERLRHTYFRRRKANGSLPRLIDLLGRDLSMGKFFGTDVPTPAVGPQSSFALDLGQRMQDASFAEKFNERMAEHESAMSKPRLGKRILVIPDTQVKPGVPVDHLTWAGKYIAEKRPDYIVHLGDHHDMPSLSSYDKGRRCFEGRRYKADIEAGNLAMNALTREYRGIPGYKPEEHFLIGNHEERISRATQQQAELDGVIGLQDLDHSGWNVHKFLDVLTLEGIKFSHYFTSGVMGRAVSSAAVLLRTAAGSAVMGHVQKVDMAVHEKTGAIALMAGTFYQHDEDYLGPQGNACRRQLVMLNECRDGIFDPMFVSLGYLRSRYGGGS